MSFDPTIDAMVQLGEGQPPFSDQRPKTEEDLLAIVRSEIYSSVGWSGQVLQERRREALEEYFGEPYGNERDGHSQVVSRDVFEVVEALMPDLLEVFAGSTEIARFDGHGPEDDEGARQATDWTNHVFMKQNEGFLILETWIKDALIQKNGIVKFWYEDSSKVTQETYEGKTEIEIAQMVEDPTLEILELEPTGEIAFPDPETGEPIVLPTFTVYANRSDGSGQIMIENVPPEEFLITREAKSIKTSRFCGHRVRSTPSKLAELGYDPSEVMELHGWSTMYTDAERIARASQDDGDPITIIHRENRGDSEREIWLVECYVDVDMDGDGISELWKVVVAGEDAYALLEAEQVEMKPFASISPILVPHRFFGLSEADAVSDLQEINTALWRLYLDAGYELNQPRWVVLGTEDGGPACDVDQLLSSVSGGIVTEYMQGAIRPLVPDRGALQSGLEAMDHTAGKREERTGVTKYTQGTEAPELNKTATALVELKESANKRTAFIARKFAETGVKDLFQGIYHLTLLNDTTERMIRVREEWIPVDPSSWRDNYDVEVSVGLGHGDHRVRVANLNQVAQIQKLMNDSGLGGLLVTPENAYNLTKEILSEMGYKNASRFFTKPTEESLAAASKDEPNIELLKLEVEERAQSRKLELQELEIRLTHTREMAKIGLPAFQPPLPPGTEPVGPELGPDGLPYDPTTGMPTDVESPGISEADRALAHRVIEGQSL